MTGIIYFGGKTKRRSTFKNSSTANHKHILSHPSVPRHYTHKTQFEPDAERIFLEYVSKVWIHCHEVPQNEQELVVVDVQTIQDDFKEFLQRGGIAPQRGSTLEELYLMSQLMQKIPLVCLMSDRQPLQPSARILRKAILDPTFIVNGLVRGIESLERKGLTFFAKSLDNNKPGLELRIREWPGAFLALTYDGETGHCVTIVSVDSATRYIVYYDPWPGKSLLAEGNNIAGVCAVPYIGRGDERLWLIKPSELERVLFAVNMPTQTWQDFSAMA